MTPLELFRRKYQQAWTDSEIIILMKLHAIPSLRLSDLNHELGIPMTTVHAALSALTQRSLIHRKTVDRNKFYSLTDDGQFAILSFLKSAPPPPRDL